MSSQSGYSTLNQNGFAANNTNAERAPLLGKPSTHDDGKGSVTTRLSKHWNAEVSKSWADIALLGCYIITGLLDSSSVFIWGSFVSMQTGIAALVTSQSSNLKTFHSPNLKTGNTVYLGLGIVAPHDSDRWIRSGISIAFFCLGSLFFAAYHRKLSPRKRWVLVTSHLIQLALIIAAALMVTLGPQTTKETPFNVYIGAPIALIAFQAAGQAVTSRVLKYNSLTSVVLTSIYCDLFSDPLLLAAPQANPERNRRAAAPVLLLLGAVLGGLWAHSNIGLAGALWTAVILKVVVVGAWSVWAAEDAE